MLPKRHLWQLGGCCAGAFLLCLVGLILWQSRRGIMKYVHPARSVRATEDTPARYNVPYQNVTLVTTDGLHLQAWYTPPQNGALILVAHGIRHYRLSDMHALFARHGYGVLSWDFRAHGESEGDTCSLGYYETWDVAAALDYALAQPEVRHVGAWGGSMGGTTVILAAARRTEIEAVVADSAFYSLEAQLRMRAPAPLFVPPMRFFAERETHAKIAWVDAEAAIAHLSPRPVLLIQEQDDPVIASESAERLYQAAGEPREKWIVAGRGHLNLYARQPAEYERRVIGFFDRALLNQPTAISTTTAGIAGK